MSQVLIRKLGEGESAHTVSPPIKTLAAGADPTVGVRMAITPAIATEWLETRGSNRKVNQSVVDRYANDMKEGRWLFNGAPIQFDEEGKLLNGQHRLWAIVESGCDIDTVVQWNIPRESQSTIDAGTKWQLKDLLYMEGERNTVLLQATLRWLWRDETGAILAGKGMSNSKALEVLERHPRIRHSVDFISTVKSPLHASAAAYLHYKVSENDPDKATEFFTRLADGIGLTEFNPIYRLRERLLSFHGIGRMASIEALALAIVAWNAFRSGREVRSLMWRMSGRTAQAFPLIEGVTGLQTVKIPRGATNKNSRRKKELRNKVAKANRRILGAGTRKEVSDAMSAPQRHIGKR